MDSSPDQGLFLTLQELRALFPRLKRMEPTLAPRERTVFLKIERCLYQYHSIEEIETLLQGPTNPPDAGSPGTGKEKGR